MDDMYEPEYLERMLAALDERPDAAIAHCRASAIAPLGTSMFAVHAIALSTHVRNESLSQLLW